MTGGKIREMTLEDIGELMELERECFPLPWTENMFKCQIMMEDLSSNLVYVEDGKIKGYVIAWFGYEELHILSIGVLPERRGSGIADLLLDQAIETGRDKAGHTKVLLEVRRSNRRAQGFYRKKGFREIGVRKGYYSETGEDAIVLEKDIEEKE